MARTKKTSMEGRLCILFYLPTSTPYLPHIFPHNATWLRNGNRETRWKSLLLLHTSCLKSRMEGNWEISFCSTECLLTKRASWLQNMFPQANSADGDKANNCQGCLCADGYMDKLFSGILFSNWLKINWLTISSGLKVTRNLDLTRNFHFGVERVRMNRVCWLSCSHSWN